MASSSLIWVRVTLCDDHAHAHANDYAIHSNMMRVPSPSLSLSLLDTYALTMPRMFMRSVQEAPCTTSPRTHDLTTLLPGITGPSPDRPPKTDICFMRKLSQSGSRVKMCEFRQNTSVKTPDKICDNFSWLLVRFTTMRKQSVAGIVAEIVAWSGKKTVFQISENTIGRSLVTVRVENYAYGGLTIISATYVWSNH